MNFFIACTLVNNRRSGRDEKIERKVLRDYSNPLDMPDTLFVCNYRLNKEAFVYVLDKVGQFLQPSSVPPLLQLATTPRFLAKGGFHRSVGNDRRVSLARSTTSKVLSNVLLLLETHLCSNWIKLHITDEEIKGCKRHFFEKFNFPGVVGCVDGTHVKVVKPTEDEHLFYNRKGYFSINCMIICDHKMRIYFISACHPESCHDSFIWNLSGARNNFLQKYNAGERRSWLLGDCGYGIEPFLLTPYRDPMANSVQHKFNRAHSSARNIVERTIGILKSRFWCLAGTLWYKPRKASRIINVCCALHNICKHFNLPDMEAVNDSMGSYDEVNVPISENVSFENEGKRIRDEIARNL